MHRYVKNKIISCNYINFNGKARVHLYQGKEVWTSDGKRFLCGVNDIFSKHILIYSIN